MITAVLLGSGGSLPIPKRYLTALYLNIEGTSVLIDCGEGTQVAFSKADRTYNSLSVICITHNHADHIFGLPGLLSSIDQVLKLNAGSKHSGKIVIVAPKTCKWVLEALLSATSLTKLRVIFAWIEQGVEESEFAFPNFTVTAYRLHHSVECYGYAVRERVHNVFSKEKAEQCKVGQEAWKFLEAGYRVIRDNEIYSIDDITDKKRIGVKIAYATDTTMCSNLTKCVEGADLAVLEGMYFNCEQFPLTIDSKHLTFEDAATLARDGGVKELWLTHFSPVITNPRKGLENIEKIFENVTCGYCGLSTIIESSIIEEEGGSPIV